MTEALELAKLILTRNKSPMNSVQLQKLVYYCQAWHVTALNKPLFSDTVQAWRYGPLVPKIWDRTRGQHLVDASDIEANLPELDLASAQLVDAVLDYYSHFSPWTLVDMTHADAPYKDVYVADANIPISIESMRMHYSGVVARNEARPAIQSFVYTYVEEDEFDQIQSSLDDETPATGLLDALKSALLV